MQLGFSGFQFATTSFISLFFAVYWQLLNQMRDFSHITFTYLNLEMCFASKCGWFVEP